MSEQNQGGLREGQHFIAASEPNPDAPEEYVFGVRFPHKAHLAIYIYGRPELLAEAGMLEGDPNSYGENPLVGFSLIFDDTTKARTGLRQFKKLLDIHTKGGNRERKAAPKKTRSKRR